MEELEIRIYVMHLERLLIFTVEGKETEKIYYITSYNSYKDNEIKDCRERYYRFYNYKNGYDVGAPKNQKEYFDMDNTGNYEGVSDYIKLLVKKFTDTEKIDFTTLFSKTFQRMLKRGDLSLWVDGGCIGLSDRLEEKLAEKVFNYNN